MTIQPSRTHIAWSVAAVTFVAAMGFGGAFYRTQQTNQKFEATIAHLRDAQRDIGKVATSDTERLSGDVARLKQELADAQEAQRALTAQLFAAQEEVKALTEKLAAQAEPKIKEVTVVKDSPYPAYLALKRAALSGEPYHEAWEAMLQQPMAIDKDAKEALAAHQSGIASLTALKQHLLETYENAHKVTEDDTVLTRLGGILSIRKLDAAEARIRDAVKAGDLSQAAHLVRENEDYADWIAAYDARRKVIGALNTLEKGLDQHG